jgi:hypothetical protein
MRCGYSFHWNCSHGVGCGCRRRLPTYATVPRPNQNGHSIPLIQCDGHPWSGLLFAFMVSAFFASLAYLCLRHSFCLAEETYRSGQIDCLRVWGCECECHCRGYPVANCTAGLCNRSHGCLPTWRDWAAVRDSTASLILASLLFRLHALLYPGVVVTSPFHSLTPAMAVWQVNEC